MKAVDLVYQDESLLIVNKPAGLLSVPGRGADKQDCLSARLQLIFPDALIVHRLDMATSGLMVFARSVEMQRLLSMGFRDRDVEKRYVAIVAGTMASATGEVALPIVADWPNRPLRKIDAEHGKPSLTRYRVLNYEKSVRAKPVEANFVCSPSSFDKLRQNGLNNTRLELEPVTGRTHQLRVHMMAIGHPILGDALYGDAGSASRLLLHASSLRFKHPFSNEPLNFQSPAPF